MAATHKSKRETAMRRLLAEQYAHKEARRRLATAIGTVVLDEIEAGGQMAIKDYEKITPTWALSRWRSTT